MNQDRLSICWTWCRDVLFYLWGLEKILIPPKEEFLEEPGASFVTFKKNKELRGCIGTLQAVESLREDLRKNTLASATRDPRFPAIQKNERYNLSMEISILSPPRRLDLKGSQLLDYLKRNRPGVILQKASRRATFLPQVWEDLPDPRYFLERLALKAALNPSAWEDVDTEFSIYNVQHYARELVDPNST